MESQTSTAPFRGEIPRLLVPLGAFAAMAAFAAREVDPAGAAESGYLAVLATALLLAVAMLPRPALETGLGAVLATAAVWALPPGPGRGAAVVAVLAASFTIAAVRALSVPSSGVRSEGLPLAVTVPLALGAQVLLRGGELLFAPTLDVRTLVALLALPVAGAAAVSVLSRRHGTVVPGIAAATAILLAPGWNVASTLALLCLAAGDVLASPESRRWQRAAALVPLLVTVAWEPGPGLAAALCGLALWRPRTALGLAVALAAALHLLYPGRDLTQAVWLLLLVPAAALPERGRIENVATALLLAATIPLLPDRSALAAPLALAALALRKDMAPLAQRVWTGALFVGTALLASYPWLRAEPLVEGLALLGIAPQWLPALVVAGTFLLLAVLGRRVRLAAAAAAVTAAAILLALLFALPGPGASLVPPEMPVVLDAGHPAWEGELAGPAASVVVESSLMNGAGLPAGTPVAVLRLRSASGKTLERTLRAGEDTAEWAARRPDVARLGPPSPPAFVSRVTGGFFAQRYRSRWDLAKPGRFVHLRIERAPGLPADLGLAVHHLEVRATPALFLPKGDPFRGTLLALPLILGMLWGIGRGAARLGARPLDAGGTARELAILGVLVMLALSRSHLGLARAEEVIAAGLLLVLAHRVARQLLALRPLLGDRLPDRPSVLFFLLPLAAYLAILPWSAHHRQPDGDEPFYLLVTHSLAYDFDDELTDNYARADWRHFMDRPIEPQPGDPVGPDGEQYSRHNEMLPLVLVPAYRLGGKMGALAVMAALTAALAWMTLRLARRYFPESPGEALAAYALVAFTPPLLLYSYQVWVEVPAALLLAAGLDRILRLDRQRPWGWKDWLGIGLPVLLLPLLKIRFILVAGPLLALGWWHAGRSRRPILILGFLLGALAAGMLFYNQLVYSNPLKIHTWEEVDPQRYGLDSYLKGGFGLFYDAAFGLLGCAPIWLLLVPAVPLALARRRSLLAHLAVLTLPYLVIVAPRSEWYGGWSPPFRYALIALPLLGLALVPLLIRRERPGAQALLAALGALTLVLTLVWIAVPGWTYNFADGRTYALDLLSERLGADLTRFFPSSVRPRTATWIWPPLTFLVVPLLWWAHRRPRREDLAGRRGQAALTGVALLLAMAAVLPAAASRLPTRLVELEDPQVWKSGGHPHPERWVIERTRFQGGWVLRVGERLRVPVSPGGRRVRLVLDAELIPNQPVPFTLDLLAGDRLLASWTPGRHRKPEEIVLGPFDWSTGEPLVLVARGPNPPGALNGVILDRVRFDWL